MTTVSDISALRIRYCNGNTSHTVTSTHMVMTEYLWSGISVNSSSEDFLKERPYDDVHC